MKRITCVLPLIFLTGCGDCIERGDVVYGPDGKRYTAVSRMSGWWCVDDEGRAKLIPDNSLSETKVEAEKSDSHTDRKER